MSIELTKRGKIVVAVLIIVIIGTLVASRPLTINISNGGGYQPGAVTGFYKVPPQDAQQLLNSNPSLIIVDCTPGGDNYQNDNKIPKAIWSTDSSAFYNQRISILIYSTPDDYAFNYAKSLIGKAYGEIYVLIGGIEAWNNWIDNI